VHVYQKPRDQNETTADIDAIIKERTAGANVGRAIFVNGGEGIKVALMREALHHFDLALQGFEQGPDRHLLAIGLDPRQVYRTHTRFDWFHSFR
jgi:hypothetical protein